MGQRRESRESNKRNIENQILIRPSHISVTLRTSSLIPLPSTFPSLRGRGGTPLLAPYSSLTLAGLGLTYSGGYDPLIPTYPRYPQALGPQTIVHDSL
jgi:hypothetical protein